MEFSVVKMWTVVSWIAMLCSTVHDHQSFDGTQNHEERNDVFPQNVSDHLQNYMAS
jgi:hypothetical protein